MACVSLWVDAPQDMPRKAISEELPVFRIASLRACTITCQLEADEACLTVPPVMPPGAGTS